jgi:hypothetical protein
MEKNAQPRREFLKKSIFSLTGVSLFSAAIASETRSVSLKNEQSILDLKIDKYMVRHTVVFRLKNKKGISEAPEFFKAIKNLANIPGVRNFEFLKQIGKKNNFDFGLSMEFENVENYNKYSNHPDHNQFVQNYWLKEVDDFLELDFEPLI